MSSESIPAGRWSGKWFVIGFVIFGVLLFAFATVLAVRLDPAADRFHNPVAPAKKAS